MRLYAGDEDVDLEELERALTIVRRKMADPESFPGFLENPEVCSLLMALRGRSWVVGGDIRCCMCLSLHVGILFPGSKAGKCVTFTRKQNLPYLLALGYI